MRWRPPRLRRAAAIAARGISAKTSTPVGITATTVKASRSMERVGALLARRPLILCLSAWASSGCSPNAEMRKLTSARQSGPNIVVPPPSAVYLADPPAGALVAPPTPSVSRVPQPSCVPVVLGNVSGQEALAETLTPVTRRCVATNGGAASYPDDALRIMIIHHAGTSGTIGYERAVSQRIADCITSDSKGLLEHWGNDDRLFIKVCLDQ